MSVNDRFLPTKLWCFRNETEIRREPTVWVSEQNDGGMAVLGPAARTRQVPALSGLSGMHWHDGRLPDTRVFETTVKAGIVRAFVRAVIRANWSMCACLHLFASVAARA